MSKEKYILDVCRKSREAALELSVMPAKEKDKALTRMAKDIISSKKAIVSANKKDLENGRKKGLSAALLDRLTLTDKRFDDMCKGLIDITGLKDPVGGVMRKWKTVHGLKIEKVRVPIGVILIIYESRPNVTVDSSALCLKSGNAVILRGGSEAIHSNMALANVLAKTCKKCGLPEHAVQLIKYTERELIKPILSQSDYIDLVIPRGGEGLIRYVTENSSVPVIKHYKGVCHVYVDKDADLDMAENIVVNAKTQRPGVCNAIESLLIHKKLERSFLPRIAAKLSRMDVELRGDPNVRKIIKNIKPAVESDWTAEYLDLILAVKTVKDLDEAVGHINKYGSRHSDTIVTKNIKAAERFLNEVDASAVFHNVSTRFNDGGQFGFGAEIGISTDKIHARGPMGLDELTSYKYVVRGKGQIRK